MKLSLIIPVYNTSKYLNRCLDSIINQTYEDLDIICINDGSTDDSLSILKEYSKKDKRIRVIDKKNEGASKARNVGLDKANGELIAFVDSDDAIVPDMYEKMIKNMEEFDASLSICDVYRVKNNEVISYGINDEKIFLVENPILDFFKNEHIKYVIANKVFKKSLIGKTRFNTELTNSEDRFFIYEVLKKEPKVVKYNKPKYIYYFNSSSASGAEFSLKHESVIKSAEMITYDALVNYPGLTRIIDTYMFENLIIFIRKLAVSTNKNDYLDKYNNVRKRIIDLDHKININKKRKLEVLILRYFNCFYPFFVKHFTEKASKIDKNKVKDEIIFS